MLLALPSKQREEQLTPAVTVVRNSTNRVPTAAPLLRAGTAQAPAPRGWGPARLLLLRQPQLRLPRTTSNRPGMAAPTSTARRLAPPRPLQRPRRLGLRPRRRMLQLTVILPLPRPRPMVPRLQPQAPMVLPPSRPPRIPPPRRRRVMELPRPPWLHPPMKPRRRRPRRRSTVARPLGRCRHRMVWRHRPSSSHSSRLSLATVRRLRRPRCRGTRQLLLVWV